MNKREFLSPTATSAGNTSLSTLKYTREKQLTGVQLYAGDDKSFTAPFEINGIPRFILIDKQGNVLDPQMKLRPSNPDLLPFLETLEGI